LPEMRKGYHILTKLSSKVSFMILCGILSGFLLSSCGLNDDAPADSGVYDLGNLNGGCELKTEKLNLILEEDIAKDINCLEQNLDQFVQFVRREDSNYIGRLELNRFIDKFFPEGKEVARDLLKLVYDLNTIILNDPKDKLSVTKLKKLFTLFNIVNNEGRNLYTQLSGLDKNNYWARRNAIFRGVDLLAIKILETAPVDDSQNPQLIITDFLKELKEILELAPEQLNIEKIQSFLFAKKLILGGEPEIITSLQLKDLINRSAELLVLGMDVLFVETKEFKTNQEEYYFYYDVVNELTEYFFPFNDTEEILDHKDLLVVAEEIVGDSYNISNMDKSILVIKEKFFGGAPDRYNFRDLKTILNWGLEFSGMLYFNEITYEHYEEALSSPNPISGLSLPKLNNYHIFPQWMIKSMWENFSYISTNYRFFHDEDGKSHFFNYYKRFKSGFNKASMLRWAVKKVVSVYGHYPEGKRKKEADEDDLRRLLLDIEGLAKELGLWPKDFDKFVTEAIASSDLFVYHSDGNGSSSTEEITEYAVNALHGFELADTIHQRLQAHCDLLGEDGQSFAIPCFREYFLHVFFNELKYQKYYNRLFEYLNLNGIEELRQYLINIELYARIDPNPERPLTKEDLNRVVVIMTNLESAFIRFDVDKDGILNRGELDLAFLVFKSLVVKVAGLGDNADGLYKSIFLYLVKNMEVPSPVQLVWFHLFGKKKNITSTRFNISAILKNFVLSD